MSSLVVADDGGVLATINRCDAAAGVHIEAAAVLSGLVALDGAAVEAGCTADVHAAAVLAGGLVVFDGAVVHLEGTGIHVYAAAFDTGLVACGDGCAADGAAIHGEGTAAHVDRAAQSPCSSAGGYGGAILDLRIARHGERTVVHVNRASQCAFRAVLDGAAAEGNRGALGVGHVDGAAISLHARIGSSKNACQTRVVDGAVQHGEEAAATRLGVGEHELSLDGGVRRVDIGRGVS